LGGLTAEAVNLLDRPVWSSLTTAHADLAQGDARALRYRPEVNVFVSPADHGAESIAAAASLVGTGERAFIVQAVPVPDLPRLATVMRRAIVQMVFEGPLPPIEANVEITPLSDNDADEMLALATLQQPGPFRRETRRMGRFVGIKRGGRLAAMAGERFRFPGFRELSGVCTHPDFAGQGLGTGLSAHVTRAILDLGERPFLHAWSDNRGAIALYERLGYHVRRELAVTIVERR
jgi:ribosomal protein S18 acetylase RimI-like enzyme